MATTRAHGQQVRTPTDAEIEKARRLGIATARKAGLSDADAAICVEEKIADVQLAAWRGAALFSTVVCRAVERAVAKSVVAAKRETEKVLAWAHEQQGSGAANLFQVGPAPRRRKKPVPSGQWSAIGGCLLAFVRGMGGVLEHLIPCRHEDGCPADASCRCAERNMVWWLRWHLRGLDVELREVGHPGLRISARFDEKLITFITKRLDTGGGGWVESRDTRPPNGQGRSRNLERGDTYYWAVARRAACENIARRALALSGIPGRLYHLLTAFDRVDHTERIRLAVRALRGLPIRARSKGHENAPETEFYEGTGRSATQDPERLTRRSRAADGGRGRVRRGADDPTVPAGGSDPADQPGKDPPSAQRPRRARRASSRRAPPQP